MPSVVALTVNGVSVEVAPGTTVAVAAMQLGQPCRTSVSGTPRGPLCGMGICFECRDDDQWRIALPQLPDPVRIGNGCDHQ